MNNQDKVTDFLNGLKSNESIISIAKYFNKDIETVIKLAQKYISILHYKDKTIKEVKLDFLENESNIKIVQKITYKKL